jgi:hypothetical protein
MFGVREGREQALHGIVAGPNKIRVDEAAQDYVA